MSDGREFLFNPDPDQGNISFFSGGKTGRSIYWRSLQSFSETVETIYTLNRETKELVPIEDVNRFGRPRREETESSLNPLCPHFLK